MHVAPQISLTVTDSQRQNATDYYRVLQTITDNQTAILSDTGFCRLQILIAQNLTVDEPLNPAESFANKYSEQYSEQYLLISALKNIHLRLWLWFAKC